MADKLEIANAELESALECKEPGLDEFEVSYETVIDESRDFDSSKIISPLNGEVPDVLSREQLKDVEDMTIIGKDGLECEEARNYESKIRTENIAGGASEINGYKIVSAMKDKQSDDFNCATTDDDIDRTIDQKEQVTASKFRGALECKEPGISGSVIRIDNIDGEVMVSATCEPISLWKDEDFDHLISVMPTDGMKEEKSKEGSDLRERRKSKYLSPPYVDLSKGSKDMVNSWECETDNAENPKIGGEMEGINASSGCHGGSPLIAMCSSKKRQRILLTEASDTPGILDAVNAASAALLSELHLAALDCLYPYGNKEFDSIEIFFTRFRSRAFENVKVVGKDTDTQRRKRKNAAEEVECNAPATSQPGNLKPNGLRSNVKKQQQKTRKTKDNNMGRPHDGDNVSIEIKPRRKRKKNLTSPIAPPSGGTGGIPDLNGNAMVSDPSVEASLLKIQASCEGNIGKKKRRRRRKKGIEYNITAFPCTNGNIIDSISLEVCLNEIGAHSPATPLAVGTNATAGSPGTNKSSSSANLVVKQPLTFQPPREADNPTGEVNSLDDIRRNLELMTSMLEKYGKNLSPDMRDKLEKEIRGLLKKVSTMVGSPSS